ncbi:calcium permeable stress-gated cation channel 1 isoform X8 [Cryptomeria japonica]|uniref:calcium permeable stress-gated cation channel 1 isoform X8 n=1 Tax=Cryptomeria japonica TaxID=3369 RepID=UPI0027DA32CF|nr:calcium permeable stress-gated cation channel 1 isoform X8 [Cryptomeria japonica]
MATLQDIGVAAGIHLLTALIFLFAFAILRLQPINDRVYFPKWYLKGLRESPRDVSTSVGKFINIDWRIYIKFLNWIPEALKMPESELIEHAGLDSVVYLRIYIVGLKVFVPLMVLAFTILVPVNATSSISDAEKDDVGFSDIDKFSISNVSEGSNRFWAHVLMSCVFTIWTCFVLYKEYEMVESMRICFLEAQHRRPDQFTVLVRNVPADPDESISEHIEHFFRVNHRDHYLTHQSSLRGGSFGSLGVHFWKVVFNANKLSKLVKKKEAYQNWLDYNQNKYVINPKKRPNMKKGFLGLWGEQVDSIDYYKAKIDALVKEIAVEHERILKDPKAIMPVGFVSFKTRWGAAACAQTQQSKNPTIWLTEKVVKSFIQGFLPGLAMKLFLLILPSILMTMSKIEGHTSFSEIERKTASKYYYFILIIFFFGSILVGSALQDFDARKELKDLGDSPTIVLKKLGVLVPMRATFFITYIMVDGWSGIAGEILRLIPLIMFHLKNSLLVKTDEDREKAMDPGSVAFAEALPRMQLYFLLGLAYSVATPTILPFIVLYFGFGYFIFRHQVINVYEQKYESAAAFWPDVHYRIIISLLISQLLLLGLLTAKNAKDSAPILIILPFLTIWFHKYCQNRFEPAFSRYPLEEAMAKDTLERATEPGLDLKQYLANAYVHPMFKDDDELDECEKELLSWRENDYKVLTKRTNTPIDTTASTSTTFLIER